MPKLRNTLNNDLMWKGGNALENPTAITRPKVNGGHVSIVLLIELERLTAGIGVEIDGSTLPQRKIEMLRSHLTRFRAMRTILMGQEPLQLAQDYTWVLTQQLSMGQAAVMAYPSPS
ncbi:TPA: hypothetical protein ACIRVE_005370 [Pseudomonas putida]